MTRTDTFRDDGRLCILAHMNHLGTRVGLLIIVGNGYRIEFCLRIVAPKNTRRILPSNGAARFYLCPRQLRAVTAQVTALRYEVKDTSSASLITRIPVLNS